MASNKNSATGLTTGFAGLDRVTCGWQPGEEIVIAARPAVGKTAFALHLACTAASAGYHWGDDIQNKISEIFGFGNNTDGSMDLEEHTFASHQENLEPARQERKRKYDLHKI